MEDPVATDNDQSFLSAKETIKLDDPIKSKLVIKRDNLQCLKV